MIDIKRCTAELAEALDIQEKACKYAHLDEDFDGLVKKLMAKGYSREYAVKIAGKVAKEKGDIKGAK